MKKVKPILDLKKVQSNMSKEEFAEYCIVNMDNEYFMRHFNAAFDVQERVELALEMAKLCFNTTNNRMERIAADLKAKKINKTEYQLLNLLNNYEREETRLRYDDLMLLLCLNMDLVYNRSLSTGAIEKILHGLMDKRYLVIETVRLNKNELDRDIKTKF